MALEFRPPTDLVNAYMSRPSPGQEASQAILGAFQTYAAQKALATKQDLEQQQRDVEIAKGVAGNGQDFTDALNQVRSQRLAPQSPDAQSPSLIDRWHQFMGTAPVGKSPNQASGVPVSPQYDYSSVAPQAAAGGVPPTPGKPTAPVMGSDPAIQEFLRIGAPAYQHQHGSAGLAKVKTALEIEKGLQDKNNQTITPRQYTALSSGKEDQLATEFPNGIPKDYVGSSLSATSRNVTVMPGPTGAPMRVSKASGTPAEPVTVPGVSNQTNPLQSKLTPNEYNDWLKESNDFENDSVVKAERNSLAGMNNIESEIAKYNPSMTGPLKSQQARAIAHEVGALTDSDIIRQSLDPSLLGRLKNFVSVAATGEIPMDQLQSLKETVNTIKQASAARIASVANERVARKVNLYGGKVNANDLMGTMNLPTNFSVAKSKSDIPTIDSQEAYAALPSGASYLSSDGLLHKKK